MRWLHMAILAAVLSSLGLAAGAEGLTVENAPPVVVRTEPLAGAADVPANTDEIRVTFSKQMRDKDWSWVTVPQANFPKLRGEPHFSADLLTCILPVSLDAGRTYAIWLNSLDVQNFQDVNGDKAVPYLLVFKTR